MKIEDLNNPDETVTNFLKECFPLIDEFDTPEIKELAGQNSILAQFATMARDEGVMRLIEQTKCFEEVKVIWTAALLKNVYIHQVPFREELKKRQKDYKILVKHDYLRKDLRRNIEFGEELAKIRQSASKDAYYAILKLLNDYYSEVHPDYSQRELFALIYDKLSLLKPAPEKERKFYSPEKVVEMFNKDSVPSEADLITFKYDEIKRDIWKAKKS